MVDRTSIGKLPIIERFPGRLAPSNDWTAGGSNDPASVGGVARGRGADGTLCIRAGGGQPWGRRKRSQIRGSRWADRALVLVTYQLEVNRTLSSQGHGSVRALKLIYRHYRPQRQTYDTMNVLVFITTPTNQHRNWEAAE